MVFPRKNLNAHMQYKYHNQQEMMKGEDKIALPPRTKDRPKWSRRTISWHLKSWTTEDRISEKKFPNSQRWPFPEIPGTGFLFAVALRNVLLRKRKTTKFCFKNNAHTSFLVLILSQSENSMTKWSVSHRYLNIGADLLKRDCPGTIAISFHEEEGSYGCVSISPQPHIVGRSFKHRRAQLDKRFPTKTLKATPTLLRNGRVDHRNCCNTCCICRFRPGRARVWSGD